MRLALALALSACGSVQATPQPADAALEPPPGDAAADAAGDAPPPRKLIFVTSQAFTGNLGGIAGADAKCQTLAQAAGRPGTFKAWLGNATTSAASRVTHATIPYVLVDGTTVAGDFTGLTSGTLLHAIDVTELGTAALGGTATECFTGATGKLVWTNARPDGTIVNTDPASSCGADWNSSGPSTDHGPFGIVGNIGASDAKWTLLCGSGRCETTAPLYCLEQ